MRRLLLALAACLLAYPDAAAQPRPIPGPAQAAAHEAALATDPALRDRRSSLLSYYFSGAGARPANRAIRRGHILWFIENAPDDPVLLGSVATIDPAGHALADPEGFRLASAAWRRAVAPAGAAPAVLANAAYFFKLHQTGLATELLERATAAAPDNKEYGSRLGDLYALTILGITMINRSGFPTAFDAARTKSPAAITAREALTTSRNPFALAKAGYTLAFQGSILRRAAKLAFDPIPLASAAVERAIALAPGDAEVAGFRAALAELANTR